MKPILFNTEMVKAILNGRKTQTRRVIKIASNFNIKAQGIDSGNAYGKDRTFIALFEDKDGFTEIIKSKYKVDDILYVREPTKVMSPPVETCKKLTFKYLEDNKITEIYLDDDFDYSKKWIQRCQGVPNGCIKKMARIFLKVTNVRVERLQNISKKDVLAEGIREHAVNQFHPHTCLLETLWNSTAKDGYKWEDNPYVFVYEFERLKAKEMGGE